MNTEMQGPGNYKCSECGGCGGHGMGYMHGHRHWAHIIIKICVALFIFWCGVQFGELKALLHGGYSSFGGYEMMGGYGARNQVYYTDGTRYGMMSGWARTSVQSATSTR